MRRGIGRLRAANGVDSDAAAWAAAVVSNGGTYSASTLSAVSTFVKSAKASGYWTKINRINLFCGDQLAAAMVPLKAGGGSATETNVNFVSGDYSESTGLTGNGSTKYLRTGLVPSVSLTLNDTHMSVYNRASAAPGAAAYHIGVSSDAGVNQLIMNAPWTDGKLYDNQYNNAAGSVTSTAVLTGPYGHLVGSRTASNAHSIYQRGSSVGSNATNAGGLPTLEIYVCAFNNDGVVGGAVSQALAGYSVGAGLSAGDVTAFSTHMQTFQAALSRSV